MCPLQKKFVLAFSLQVKIPWKFFKRNITQLLFHDNNKILKQNQETAAGPQSSFVQNDLEQFCFEFFVGNKCWSLHDLFFNRCTINLCVRPSTNAFDIASAWCNGGKEKILRWKISTDILYNTLETHTKYAHSVRGRPTLKNVERFQSGSVREPYERSLYERTFTCMSEHFSEKHQLSYLMLIKSSTNANLIVYVDVIVNQAEYQYEGCKV